MARIATGKGDAGRTQLADGDHVRKSHSRIHTYGTVDELSSVLGIVRNLSIDTPGPHGLPALDDWIGRVQKELLVLGADLAAREGKLPRITDAEVNRLDEEIDGLEGALPAQKHFLIPGGTDIASHLHLARTVCRRAERWGWQVEAEEGVSPAALVYLNRLSDALYLWARWENRRSGVSDELVPVRDVQTEDVS